MYRLYEYPCPSVVSVQSVFNSRSAIFKEVDFPHDATQICGWELEDEHDAG
jgi:hypothetical protein